MIAFYDNTTYKLLGTVKLVEGKLVSSTDAFKEFENDDPEFFFKTYSEWSNGYEFSFEVPDDEEPDQTFDPGEPEVWTAEQVKNAQKQ